MCWRLAVGMMIWTVLVMQADEPAVMARLGSEFAERTQPILKSYCLSCHSTEKHEGELDLERFKRLEDVRRDAAPWLKMVEVLHQGEMPPKEARPLPSEEKKELLSWIDRYLSAEAEAQAGDPGPVVLRRLTNAEYTYTIQDITGVPLEPAKEFPLDSAAGEGFTNTGSALVMSPGLLQKYLDAGKEIARHAVLLPDGIRFSPSTTRGDWNNGILEQIREIYSRYAEIGGGVPVNLQGVVFNTNDGGRIPLIKYLDALGRAGTIESTKIAEVAKERNLNEKYLRLLVEATGSSARDHSWLADIRDELKSGTTSSELATAITRWQQALTKFQNVGHMKSWMVPVDPIVTRQEIRLPFAADLTDPTKNPSGSVKVYLSVDAAGDGSGGDVVFWEQPRLVAPGRPDLLLKDVRSYLAGINEYRTKLFTSTAEALKAATELPADGAIDRQAIAAKEGIDESALTAWFDYLGVGISAASRLDLFQQQVKQVGGYEQVAGWGVPETPSVIANASDSDYRVPGMMKGHGIGVHPSPTMQVAIGWKSPIRGSVRVEGKVTHAHPECGNGVVWKLDIRRSITRRTLAEGVSHGATPVSVGPIDSLAVEPGDLVSILVGPRDGDHACDLTSVEITLTESAGEQRVWNLSKDVSSNMLAGNPHADSFGTPTVWHFYQEAVSNASRGLIPAGSLLAKWQDASSPVEKKLLAEEVEKLLVNGPPADAKPDQPDVVLYRQLASLGGPLLFRVKMETGTSPSQEALPAGVGLESARFGKDLSGVPIDAANLCVQAPSVIEFTLPADLVAGGTLAASATLHETSGKEGSVQVNATSERTAWVEAVMNRSDPKGGLMSLDPALPIMVAAASPKREEWLASLADFRAIFPAALCYNKIVPVDEVITLTLFHREDEPLCRLMLSEAEQQTLDRLWTELHFVSQDKLAAVDAFLQLIEYASQDGKPSDFEPFRQPIFQAADEFKRALIEAEPKHLDAVVELARRLYRRSLIGNEEAQVRDLYATLRSKGIAHDDAIVLVLARLFVSPKFLYRLEEPPASDRVAEINDNELASRLSYFLWSSAPDEELMQLARQGRLREPETLRAQVRRLLADPKSRRLAEEFGLQWLQIYSFRSLDEKSERHFPEFNQLRADMEEEAVQYLADLFRQDGSLLNLFDSDYTFVNDRLAAFYGIADIAGPAWRRVEGVRSMGRGGVLGFSATMAKNSGASRTSPILRGTWMSEVILGEKLPKPPKNVPVLPDEESSTAELSVRQMVEKHSSDEKCAGCHRKIDPYGFAFENYDAIGRYRTQDLANRPIDTRTTLPDGTAIGGAHDLRRYLLDGKRRVVMGQFLRKLIGYSLGRSVQLSDQPLLEQLLADLEANDFRFSVALEGIVQSPAFRSIRGKEQAAPASE
jgi:hypothetical protein